MRQDELIRALRKVARARGEAFVVERAQGKGSHARVWMGARRTTIPRKAAAGTLAAILKQLGVSREEWER